MIPKRVEDVLAGTIYQSHFPGEEEGRIGDVSEEKDERGRVEERKGKHLYGLDDSSLRRMKFSALVSDWSRIRRRRDVVHVLRRNGVASGRRRTERRERLESAFGFSFSLED